MELAESALLFITLKAFSLYHRLHVDSLLLFQSLNCHILFFRCVLNTNVLLVVTHTVLEARTLQDLPLHHYVKLCVLCLVLDNNMTYPLEQGEESQQSEKEDDTVDGKLAWLSLHLFLNHSVSQKLRATDLLIKNIILCTQLYFIHKMI